MAFVEFRGLTWPKDAAQMTDVYTIRKICLRSLGALVTLPQFAMMKSVEELDKWFDDQMLGSP
jgi:hypothetical protein